MNGGKKRKILLVEDEAIIAITGRKSLEKYGYDVITANSGEHALDLIRKYNDIDLILMDINLGSGIDGTEAAVTILNERVIPVVFLSSHTEPDIVAKTENITSYGYVVKNSGITVLDASIKMAFKLFDANREILKNEVKQQAMISNISDVIGIISIDGIIKYKSPNIEKWFGWKPDDLIGTDAWLTVYPDDLDRIKKDFNSILKEDNMAVTVEYRYKCRDDSYRWIELTAVNCIKDDAINGVLINYHDIQERKLTKDKLNESLMKLDSAQGVAKIGFWDLDMATMNLEWSTGLKIIFGLNPDSPTPSMDEFWDYVFPDDRAFVEKQFASQIKPFEKSEYGYIYRITTKKGDVKYLYHIGRQSADKDGRITGIYGSVQDVTFRKMAEEALIRHQDLLNTIIEGTTEAIFAKDIDGRYITINEVGAEMLGYKKSDIIGHTDLELLPAAIAEEFRKTDEHVISTGEFYEREETGLINGRLSTFLAHKTPWFDNTGKIIGIIGVSIDITGRKQAVDMLRESDEEHRLILDSLLVGVVIHDSESAIIKSNPEASVILGLTPDQMTGRKAVDPAWMFVHEDLTPMKIEEYPVSKVIADKKPLSDYMFGIRRPDREYITWVNVNAIPLFQSNGELKKVIINFVDITDRKRAEDDIKTKNEELNAAICEMEAANEELTAAMEELDSVNEELINNNKDLQKKENALLEGEEKFRNLVLSMQVGVLLQSPESEILLSNPKALELLGLTEDQLLGKTSFDPDWNVIHEDGSPFPGPTHPVPQAIATRSPVRNAVMGVYRPVKGDRIWLSVDAEPQLNDDGTVKQVVCTFIDITERIDALEALRESEKRLRGIFEQAAVGVAQIDSYTGRFIRINQKYCDILGYTREEMLQKSFQTITHPDDIQPDLDNMKKILSGEIRSFSMEKRYYRKDNSIVLVNLTVSPLWNIDEKPDYHIAVVEDITERKIAEEKIKTLLAEKEIILKEVHHRIKNNMNTIFGLLTIQADAQDTPETKSVLFDAGLRVQSMMLLYDKLYQSAGFTEISVAGYLPILIDEIVSNFNDCKSVKIEKKIDDFIMNVKKLQPLGIIINELLTNVMKYAFNGRSDCLIRISATLSGEDVLFVIQDNGKGLPESVDFESSTGFGMQLVKMLTEQIGGTIGIERGEGTRFVIKFPV